MQNDTGPRGGCTFAFLGFVIVFGGLIALAFQ